MPTKLEELIQKSPSRRTQFSARHREQASEASSTPLPVGSTTRASTNS